MNAIVATTLRVARPRDAVRAQRTAAPGLRPLDRFLPRAAFHLLCFWTRSTPESVGRMLGADGFDAGFGLGEGKR